MAELYGVLTTIALLDSTSMLTISTVPMIAMMSSQRPVSATLAFVVGTFATYFACSVLVFWGLDSLFDAVSDRVMKWWNDPDATDLILQFVIAVVMIVIAAIMIQPGRKPPERQPKSMSPAAVFGFAAILVLVGMPGAVPIFAAIDQILRADLSDIAAVWALFYYNLVFILPLLVLIFIRVALGERSDGVFAAINGFISVWGKRVVIAVLLFLGMALLADGIGWAVGWSLIPIE